VRALPEKVTTEYRYTGVVCVECPGVVHVRAEGPGGELRFSCRVGHAFSTNDLIEGKEEKIEESLWSTFETIAELIALLRDLEGLNGGSSGKYATRIQSLERQARAIAELLQSNEPVVLGSANARDDPDTGRGHP